jgi:hypothetical protein
VRAAALAALAAVVLAGFAGCSLFQDRPDRSCKKPSDCFQAQGETCDVMTSTCVAGPDARVLTPESP